MIRHRRRLDRRGGVLLDAFLSLALLILGAFALESMGLTFGQILHGAAQFFGH